MAKVLVLYYSTYGHIETMANAVAEGARSTGATVDVKRVPETVPEDVARGAHFKLEQAAPIATVALDAGTHPSQPSTGCRRHPRTDVDGWCCGHGPNRVWFEQARPAWAPC